VRIAAIIDTGQAVSAYRNRKMVIADCYEGRTEVDPGFRTSGRDR
jgi:hypothetical protein